MLAANFCFLGREEQLELIKNNSLLSNLILRSESSRARNICKLECVLEESNSSRLMHIFSIYFFLNMNIQAKTNIM